MATREHFNLNTALITAAIGIIGASWHEQHETIAQTKKDNTLLYMKVDQQITKTEYEMQAIADTFGDFDGYQQRRQPRQKETNKTER